MEVKEESEELAWNSTFRKQRSWCPITSWQIVGENMETVMEYFLGLQNQCRQSEVQRSRLCQRMSWLASISDLMGIHLSQFISVAQSCLTLRPHESQHARPPCPSPSPGVHSDSCPSSPWCHPAFSSFVIPFSSYPQSLPASESFPMGQFFAWGGQSIGVSASASVLPMNIQDWSPLGWTG